MHHHDLLVPSQVERIASITTEPVYVVIYTTFNPMKGKYIELCRYYLLEDTLYDKFPQLKNIKNLSEIFCRISDSSIYLMDAGASEDCRKVI